MYQRSSEVETLSLYIDGEWRPASGGAYFDSVDPFTSEVWSRVPAASTEDVDTGCTCRSSRIHFWPVG